MWLSSPKGQMIPCLSAPVRVITYLTHQFPSLTWTRRRFLSGRSTFNIRRFESSAVSRRKNMVNFSKHPTAKIYELRSAISPPKIIQISWKTSRSEDNLLTFLLLFKLWTVSLVSSFYLSVNIVVFHPSICIVTMSPCHTAFISGLCHFKEVWM